MVTEPRATGSVELEAVATVQRNNVAHSVAVECTTPPPPTETHPSSNIGANGAEGAGPPHAASLARCQSIPSRISCTAWIGILIAIVTLAITLHYNSRQLKLTQIGLQYQKWEAQQDFRESCLNDQVCSFHTRVALDGRDLYHYSRGAST